MAVQDMLLQTYPIVECLVRQDADNTFQKAMFAGLNTLIAKNLIHPSLHCDLKGSHGLEVAQPIFKASPDTQVIRLNMHATSDPADFIDRLGAYPQALFPLGFVVDGAALNGLDGSNSYQGLKAVHPLNLVEGRLLMPFKHRDRFEKALVHLCGSSTRLSLGLYIPSSSNDELLARRLKVRLSSKFPVVVPAFSEINSTSPEDLAQIISQTLINKQNDLFGLGRGIF